MDVFAGKKKSKVTLKCFSMVSNGKEPVQIQWRNFGSVSDLTSDLKNISQLSFSIEHLPGTNFDKKVWEACSKIPIGQTVSYSDLAKSIGHPKAFRAVANSLGRNPLAVLIPCHRVIGKNSLGGYSCVFGIRAKELLLQIEKKEG